MRRHFSFLAILFLSALLHTAYGQTDKNVIYKVAIGEFAYTPKETKSTVGSVLASVADALLTGQTTEQQSQYAEAVRASIVNGFSHVIRFRTIDGGFQENELAGDEPALYVDGTIINISTVTKTETDKKNASTTYYRSLVSVAVNVKDAHDDTLVDSHSFNISDSNLGWLSSTDKAMSYALEQLTGNIRTFYNHRFPLYASIIEGGSTKKDKQKEVYIDLGEENGVYDGMQFNVYQTKTVAGKEARTEIGRLKIEEVQGDDISLCKVTRGGDRIKAALDEGTTLVVTSR